MTLPISISEKDKLLIKAGQKVDFNTPLFEQVPRRDVHIIISDKIKVPSMKIFQYIKKVVGETIQKGEVLAEKKSLLSVTRYKSEWEGVLKEINHTDGSVVIETASVNTQVKNAFFCGVVGKIEKNIVYLEIEKMKEYEAKEISSSFGGPIFILTKGDLNEEMIQGRVIVAESVGEYAQIKIEALGCAGFITLKKLSEATVCPKVLFSKIKDYEDSMSHPLPYCFIDRATSKIIFYR